MNKINQESEKSTLGDIDALSALKEKMEEASSKPTKKVAPKKAKSEVDEFEDETPKAKKKVVKKKEISDEDE
jgi:small subunit ribosomal protein S1